MKDLLSIIISLAIFVLVIDFLSFIAWVASGQTPPTAFFFGGITAQFLGLFF